MQRRIFVLSALGDAKALADIGLWCASHGGSLTTEPIITEGFETPFVRVTLEYASGTPPPFPDYTPFAVTLTLGTDELYTKDREVLELAVLSAYTALPVESVKQVQVPSGLDVGYFLRGGEPLWIDTDEWAPYASLLVGLKGMQLISEDPLFEVAWAMVKHENLNLPPIYKHPLVDVWYGPEPVDLTAYMNELTNVVRITPEAEGTHNRILLDEMIRAYEYKHFHYTTKVPIKIGEEGLLTYTTELIDLKLPPEYYYLVDSEPFSVAWLEANFQTVVEGFIPSVTVVLPETKTTPACIRHDIIQAYLTTLEKLGSGYLLPQLLDAIQVNTESGLNVTLIVDSKATLDEVLWNMKPYSHFHAQDVATVNEGLELRYRLSLAGIASLLLDKVVTWDGPPLDQIPPVEGKSLKAALLTYLNSLARTPEDIVSQRTFASLTPEELVDIIVTQWRNAYESKTILQLQYLEDPLNRQPLTPKELLQVGYGAKGYFSVGPLKGLRDHVIMPLPVHPPDGVITTEVYDYFTESELAIAAEEERAPIPSTEYKQVAYHVAMMDGVSLALLMLLLPPNTIALATQLITKAWNAGVFLSMWARGYIQSQHMMSDADPFIPYQLRDADRSPDQSVRALNVLKMYSTFHS